MNKPSKQNVSRHLAALDFAESQFMEAFNDHYNNYPSYVPNDRQELIAYKARKDRISKLKRNLSFAETEYIQASLALFRHGI